MNTLPEDIILEFKPDTLEAVRKMYGFQKIEELNEAIDILDSWVKKQAHFTEKEFDRDYLERMIISAKGSVERAKMNMDKICTMRNLMPNFFQDFNVREFQHVFEKMYVVLLPKITKGHERVFLGYTYGRNFTAKIYLDVYRIGLMVGYLFICNGLTLGFLQIAEYTRTHDYLQAGHIILDYRHVNVAQVLAATDLVQLHQMAVIITKGYAFRIKGIHLLTSSKIVDKLVLIAKQILSEKMGHRVQAHSDLESLYKFVPKEILPAELGGEEKPIAEINADWVDVLSSEKYREHWRKICMARTDESIRQTEDFNNDYLGMPGSFRTLSVD